MRMKLWILTLASGIVISVLTAHAHHSISGAYDTNQQKTIEGVVRQFHFINPHPFLTIDVTAPDGNIEQWRLEMDNRRELSQIGMSEQTLRQGDRVVVAGSPARGQSQSLYIRRLDRPSDGFRYEQIGSSPRVRVPR
jgi:hypothetical protein